MLSLVSIFISLVVVSPKIFEGYMITPHMYRQQNWYYLGRQILSPGTSFVSLEVSMKGIPFSKFQHIQFAIINESEWNANQGLQCNSKASYSFNHTLYMNGQNSYTNTSIKQTQPKLYYFVFRDCSQNITAQKQNYQLQFIYKLTVLNNQSHLGHYQSCFFLVMMLASTLVLCYRVIKDGQKSDEKDWVQIGLFVGLFCQAAGLVSKITSFLIGWMYGHRINYVLFNIIYSVLGSFGDSVISTVLLFISFGYTIVYISLAEYEAFIPPIAAFSFAHILLSLLGVINQSFHNKYHLYDSVPGIILIGIKIVAALVFAYGMYRSYQKSNKPQQRFLTWFGVIGILYILIVPITYFVCQSLIIQSKQQHYSTIIKETLSITFNILFSYNIVESGSQYRSNRKRNTFLPVDQKFF